MAQVLFWNDEQIEISEEQAQVAKNALLKRSQFIEINGTVYATKTIKEIKGLSEEQMQYGSWEEVKRNCGKCKDGYVFHWKGDKIQGPPSHVTVCECSKSFIKVPKND